MTALIAIGAGIAILTGIGAGIGIGIATGKATEAAVSYTHLFYQRKISAPRPLPGVSCGLPAICRSAEI